MSSRQLVSQAEFARLQGVDKSRITRLKQEGRLVLSEDGKRVDVEASRARIAETASPGHAENGQNAKGMGGVHDSAPGNPPSSNTAFYDARARKEMALAEQAEMEVAKMRGTLVEAEQVRLFLADLGATFRAALEPLPDRLAPELVALHDVDSIRSTLADNFEALLHDMAAKIEKGA